jgi:hypothetical protein
MRQKEAKLESITTLPQMHYKVCGIYLKIGRKFVH